MMFNKNQLIQECTNMLRVITTKNNGINKAYSSYLKEFDDTIYYNAQVMYNTDGLVIWKSYDGVPKPNCKKSHIENIDIAFSPGFRFGDGEFSIYIWGELPPFGDEGLYSDIFIKFEENSRNSDEFEESEYREGLFIIHNSTELVSFMCDVVKEQWEWRALFDIKYAHALDCLNQYIDEFLSFHLEPIFKSFSTVQNDIPILFHRGWSDVGHYIKGDFDPCQKDVVVNIYNCNLDDIEILKATVRHELIHYCLFHAGLPYWDDSAIFWYFALKFNANPYKTLNDNENKLLNYLNSLDDKEVIYALSSLKETSTT